MEWQLIVFVIFLSCFGFWFGMKVGTKTGYELGKKDEKIKASIRLQEEKTKWSNKEKTRLVEDGENFALIIFHFIYNAKQFLSLDQALKIFGLDDEISENVTILYKNDIEDIMGE